MWTSQKRLIRFLIFAFSVKINSLGIGGDVLAWIKAFLSNRKQRVVIEGVSSPWTNLIIGIPQGSVQGPTLFVVFINDMPSYISSFCKLFALRRQNIQSGELY